MPIIPDSRMTRVKTPSELMLEKQESQLKKFLSDTDDADFTLDFDSLSEEQKKLIILQNQEFKSLKSNDTKWILENLKQVENSDFEKYIFTGSQILFKNKELELTDLENEWNYIRSEQEFYGEIIEKLHLYGLLFEENRICDCGIGLGETLFHIYNQTLKFPEKRFKFFGIEKNQYLIDSFNQYLRDYWKEIEIINGDILEQDLSIYNIIYTYTPFKNNDKLIELYDKIVEELPIGGLLLENFNKGLGSQNCLFNLLENDHRVEIIDLDGIIVYQKV